MTNHGAHLKGSGLLTEKTISSVAYVEKTGIVGLQRKREEWVRKRRKIRESLFIGPTPT